MEKVYSGQPPYNERDKLYLMHFCFAFVSRMWDLGIVLIVAALTNNSLYLVSMMGFLSSLTIFVLMPSIGHIMDTSDRLLVVQCALIAKVSLASIVYYRCYCFESTASASNWEMYCIPVLVSFVAVCFSVENQSIEKDWIVVLSRKDSTWLAVTNSTMSQIDLVCATIAPVLTGVLFGFLTMKHVILVLMSTNAVATLCLMWFLRSLYYSWPDLAVKGQPSESERSNESVASSNGAAAATAVGWSDFLTAFLQCGCTGVLFSYSLLYLTCLSFGSIMITYLRSAGVQTELIGAARGGAAVLGCIGAAAYPAVRNYLGLYLTAQVAIGVQAALAVMAASTFFWTDRRCALIALMCSLLYIRTWIFDLAVRQIAQETIHESIRGRVNGQWKSLMALFELSGFGLAMLMPNPDHFWILCSISASTVVLSLLIYSLYNPHSCLVSSRSSSNGGYQRIVEVPPTTAVVPGSDKITSVQIELVNLTPI